MSNSDSYTYEIVRYFANTKKTRRTIHRGLSLKEARAHCEDPETSSRTCTTAAGKARTRKYGPWFDGYRKE